MIPPPETINPYPGPRPFEPSERKLFFGRDGEISDLFSLTVAHRILLVYARSGAGKTSLINAGLIPLMQEKGLHVLPVARIRDTVPREIDPQSISNIFTFCALMRWTGGQQVDPKSLVSKTLSDYFRESVVVTGSDPRSPRVVIFDQFEELFEFFSERWTEREGFIRQVADALEADPWLHVVYVMREDYLARLDPYLDLLPEQLRARYRLERLDADAAQQAIEEPLRSTNRSFAQGVAESLIRELLKIRVENDGGEMVEAIGEFVEPVQLQVVCQSLWRELPPETTVITSVLLQKYADVNNALIVFYERGIGEAIKVKGVKVKEAEVRNWFDQKLITESGTRGLVHQGRVQTGGLANAAVQVLDDYHLVRADPRDGGRWYELTHDRFIEPIQKSNRAWLRVQAEKSQRRTLIRRAVSVALFLALLCVSAIALYSWNQAQITEKQARIADQASDLTAKAWAAYNNNDFDSALAFFNQVIAIGPQPAVAYDGRGNVYRKKGNLEQALAEYSKAVELSPQYVDAYNDRGNVYYEQKNYDLALRDYNKAIELDPTYKYAYLNRGLVEYNTKQYDLALADFTKAIELDPMYPAAYNSRGFIYYTQQKYDLALADYSKAIEVDPTYKNAYLNRGRVYDAQHKYDQAIADYTKVIELDPQNPLAYNNRCFASTQKSLPEPDRAIPDCDKAIELDPNNAYAYNNRGWAQYLKGNLELAFVDVAKSIALNPNNEWAYDHRGVYYSAKGDLDLAITDFGKAIDTNPKYVDAYKHRGLAFRQRGLKPQAIADFEMYLQLSPDASDRATIEQWIRELKAA